MERMEKIIQDNSKSFAVEANRNGAVLRGLERSKKSVCVCFKIVAFKGCTIPYE